MNRLKGALSVLLSVMIALSTMTIVVSLYLRGTVMSEAFYLDIIATPTYVTKVKEAILLEFRMQSSYSGIPEEVFAETVEESELHTMLRNHIHNVVLYLNGEAEYSEPAYPIEKIKAPLTAFLDQYSEEQGYVATPEQYALLDAVAADTAEIIARHVCLIDLRLVMNIGLFQRSLSFVRTMSTAYIAGIVVLLLNIGLLAALYRRNLLLWLRGIMLGLWFAGAVFAVPAVVLAATGLTDRVAIVTPYLKYFVDSVLTQSNWFFLTFGIVLFLVSTSTLVYLGYSKREKQLKKEKFLHTAIKTS